MLLVLIVLEFALWVSLGSSEGGERKELFEPRCNVHDHAFGKQTPPSIVQQTANEEWLRSVLSNEVLQYYYKRGKAQCQEYYNQHFLIEKDLEKAVNTHVFQGYQPFNVTIACEGRSRLYTQLGMIIWPFGPYTSCTTYSSCWFGLLSCGSFKRENYQKFIEPTLQNDLNSLREHLGFRFSHEFITLPPTSRWSLRALSMHVRVVGSEIVSPEQRIFSIDNGADEVIIARYSLTLPDPQPATLEVRLMELYPMMLYDWPQKEKDIINKYRLMTVGGVPFYAGVFNTSDGTYGYPEYRFHGVCDSMSQITHSPFAISVSDGSSRCSADISQKQSTLPLCTKENSLPSPFLSKPHTTTWNSFNNPAGRWISGISSVISPSCLMEGFPSYNVLAMDYLDNITEISDFFSSQKRTSLPPPVPANHHQTTRHQVVGVNKHRQAPHQRRERRRLDKSSSAPSLSFSSLSSLASGNPCLFTNGSGHVEEKGDGHWFFSPYHCKYHFYTKAEVMKCFAHHSIHHLHFLGDSMSRELFTAVARFLGVYDATAARMKYITNTLKRKELRFRVTDHNVPDHPVEISESYTWDYYAGEKMILERQPRPDVLVVNYAIAHRTTFPAFFEKTLRETEENYWTRQKAANFTMPRYLIFQNARDLHGRKYGHFIGGMMRENSEILKEMYVGRLGFMELDEYQLSMGRFEGAFTPNFGKFS